MHNSSTSPGSPSSIVSKPSYQGVTNSQCDLMSNATNPESYLKWIQGFICVMGEKKLGKKLTTTSESLKKVLKKLKKFLKVPKRESAEQKVAGELEVTTAKVKATEAKAVHTIAIGSCYDLFRHC